MASNHTHNPNNGTNSVVHQRKVFYQDEHLMVRRFEQSDQVAVQKVFQSSMESLLPATIRQFALSPVPFLSALMVAWIVNRAVLGLALFAIRMAASGRNSNSRVDVWNNCAWWLALAAAIAALVASFLALRQKIHTAYSGFIQKACEDDLSKIPDVYFQGAGDFLVAVAKSTNEVVGCVGGQDEVAFTESNKERARGKENGHSHLTCFELRRMAVNADFRRRSVAQRLLSCLESSLLQQSTDGTNTKRNGVFIFLTTSDVQVPAHKLYKKCGYLHTDSYSPSKIPWWAKRSVRIFRFERTLQRDGWKQD